MSTDKVKLPEPVGRIYGYVGGRARVEWLRRPGGNRDPIYTEAQMLAMHEQGRLAGMREAAEGDSYDRAIRSMAQQQEVDRG
jgi:hypothetical protein